MKIHWSIDGGFALSDAEVANLIAKGVNLRDGKAVADALDLDYLDAIKLPIDVWTTQVPTPPA